jgi:hypothetical protein
MSKLIHKIVDSNPDVMHIELGAGCGEFSSRYYSKSFLTDIKDPNRGCQGSLSPLYFKANANEISKFVPNNRFELVICCNPYLYGFKTPLDAFTLLNQFNTILIPKKGKIRMIGAKGINPYFNTAKIDRFMSQYNIENKTDFKILQENNLDGLYPGFIFTDELGNTVMPNYEIVISN